MSLQVCFLFPWWPTGCLNEHLLRYHMWVDWELTGRSWATAKTDSHISATICCPSRRHGSRASPRWALAGPTSYALAVPYVGIPKVLGASVPCTSKQQNVCFRTFLSTCHLPHGQSGCEPGDWIQFLRQSRGGPLGAVLVQRAFGSKGFSITMGNLTTQNARELPIKVCYKCFLKEMSW